MSATASPKLWRYEAMGPKGTIQGQAEAASEVALDKSLAREGITLLRAKSIPKRSNREVYKMSGPDLVTFTTQLATVLGAGVPIVEGMRDLGMRMRSESSRHVVAAVVKELESGASLSGAMGSRPKSFPAIYRISVEAGEMSGSMPEVLQRLAEHMEWTRSIRQTTVQALVYPAILMGAISVLVVTLVTFLVPRIVKMFPGGVDELPWQTRQVLQVSDALTGNWKVITALMAIVGFGLYSFLRTPKGRLFGSGMMLSIPRLGEMLRMFATAKFAATAGTLQNAGCQVNDVIGLGGAACGNAKIAEAFSSADQRIKQGASISEALSKEPLMDPLLIQMVAVGEQAGDLGSCLDKVGAHYDRELPRVVKWMLSLLEPGLLVLGGLIVAYTLFAAFLPLLDMYDKL